MMNLIIHSAILCALAFFQVQGNETIKVQPRLIAGTRVDDKVRPKNNVAIFSLLNPNNAICSGAIINEKWIVTAASCVQPYHPAELRFKRSNSIPNQDEDNIGGQLSPPQGADTHYSTGEHIYKIVRHPSYVIATRANDIALINTIDTMYEQPYRITRVNPNVANTPVTLRGFGPILDNGGITSDLSEATATISPIAMCRNYDPVVPTNKLCTLRGYVCRADQGGALVLRSSTNELVGIISVSPGIEEVCGVVPIVTYTNIFLYRTWIIRTTQIPDL